MPIIVNQEIINDAFKKALAQYPLLHLTIEVIKARKKSTILKIGLKNEDNWIVIFSIVTLNENDTLTLKDHPKLDFELKDFVSLINIGV